MGAALTTGGPRTGFSRSFPAYGRASRHPGTPAPRLALRWDGLFRSAASAQSARAVEGRSAASHNASILRSEGALVDHRTARPSLVRTSVEAQGKPESRWPGGPACIRLQAFDKEAANATPVPRLRSRGRPPVVLRRAFLRRKRRPARALASTRRRSIRRQRHVKDAKCRTVPSEGRHLCSTWNTRRGFQAP